MASSASRAATAVLLFACACGANTPAHIAVDTTAVHQTMTGWEATAWAGQERPAFLLYRDTLLALASGDLGINRLRVEVRSGSEHSRDYYLEGRTGRLQGNAYRCARYETRNDNEDPRILDTAGFHFSELDNTVERVVLPLQRMMTVRGARLAVNLNYVSFFRQCPRDREYAHRDAEEYAEFVLATMLHLRGKYGLVPDTWEIILEPDNTNDWGSAAVGRAIVATAERLREDGFATRFVAPSTTAAEAAPRYFDGMRAVPGAQQQIAELAYHRYRWVTSSALAGIADRARETGVRTAMLEKIGADVDDLLDDLTIANVSAWSQYTLGTINGRDDGGGYYDIRAVDATGFAVHEQSRTPFLRQVFKAAQMGAVRVGATSDAGHVRAVAFRNPDGRLGVAMRATRAARLAVSGLPVGRYAVTYATADTARGALPDAVVTHGTATAAIPSAGVVTLLRR